MPLSKLTVVKQNSDLITLGSVEMKFSTLLNNSKFVFSEIFKLKAFSLSLKLKQGLASVISSNFLRNFSFKASAQDNLS